VEYGKIAAISSRVYLHYLVAARKITFTAFQDGKGAVSKKVGE
jgi:hypothetical protein